MNNSAEKSILFVDDEPYVLESLKRCLMNQGYKILTAQSGAEALRLLLKETVHIVVSDYDMPHMMGPELLEKVRVLQPSAIRVVLTGASDLKVIQSFIQKGKALRYLLKPWDIDEMKLTIQECFELHSEAA
jgi:response regulator RpfG family c-di-GMP phosphodiesterase